MPAAAQTGRGAGLRRARLSGRARQSGADRRLCAPPRRRDPARGADAGARARRALAPEFPARRPSSPRGSHLARGEDRKALADLAALVRRSGGKDPAALLALPASSARPGASPRRCRPSTRCWRSARRARGAGPAQRVPVFARTLRRGLGATPATRRRGRRCRRRPAAMPIGEIVLAARFLPRLAEGRDDPLPVAAHPDARARCSHGSPGSALPALTSRRRSAACSCRRSWRICASMPPRSPSRRPIWARPRAARRLARALATLPGPRIGILWHPGGRGVGLREPCRGRAPGRHAGQPRGRRPAARAGSRIRRDRRRMPDHRTAGSGGGDRRARRCGRPRQSGRASGRRARPPAVVFVPAGRHWAWAAPAGRSLWYPTVTVLTQSRPGDWSELQAGLAASIADMLAKPASVAAGAEP